jgi:hypothetical protein
MHAQGEAKRLAEEPVKESSERVHQLLRVKCLRMGDEGLEPPATCV